MKKSLIFIFFLKISIFCCAQTDTIFWFVAPDIAQRHNSDIFEIPIKFDVSSFNNKIVTIKISQPANSLFPVITRTISPDSSIEIDLSAYVSQIENTPANTVLNRGILLEATDFVSAYYEINLGNANPEIYALKGANALGTEFYIPGQNIYKNGGIYTLTIPPYSKFDIVATEDSTFVNITLSNSIVGHSAGSTFTIMLNKGQTYCALATSQYGNQHLDGSHVISNKPIAITITDDLVGGLSVNTCADLIGDQIVPIQIIGNEYIAIKGQLFNNDDKVFITAIENNTTINFVGSTLSNANLSRSQTMGFNFSSTANTMYISSNKPIYVYQMSGIGCEIGTALLPQINCTGSNKAVYRRGIGNPNILKFNIITTYDNISNFKLNGDTSNITQNNFFPVNGTNGKWYYAQINVSSYISQYDLSIVECDGLFHMGVLDGNSNWGCGYGYFSDYNKMASIEILLSEDTIEFCKNENILLLYKSKNVDSIICKYPNGSILYSPPFVLHLSSITDTGMYYLIGRTLSSCDSLVYDSIYITFYSSISVIYDTVCQGQHYLNYGFDTIFIDTGNIFLVKLNNCDTTKYYINVTLPKIKEYYFDTICVGTHFSKYGLDTIFLDTGVFIHFKVENCNIEKYYIHIISTKIINIYNDTICQGYHYTKHSIDTVFNLIGAYTKTIKYDCDSLIIINFYISESPDIFLGNDTVLCSETNFPIILNAGSGNYSYLWNTFETTQMNSISQKGTYKVIVTNKVGCSDTDEIKISLNNPLLVKIENTTDDFCRDHVTILKSNDGGISYLWFPNRENSQNIKVFESGVYRVEIEDSNHCFTQGEYILSPCPLYFPNIFSPNGDGINDFFAPIKKVDKLKNLQMFIYSKWGNLIWTIESNEFGDYNNPKFWWNGKNKNGNDVSDGVYYWVVNVESILNSEKYTLNGSVTIVR